MTEAKKEYKNDLIGAVYQAKEGNTYATVILEGMKNKRYLLEPVEGGGGDKLPAFKLYLSKIGGLKGAQIHDVENYDLVGKFFERNGKYGTFYNSTPDTDGKRFTLSPPKEEGKKYAFLLFKEKVAYKKPEAAQGQAQPTPEAKPLREFP